MLWGRYPNNSELKVAFWTQCGLAILIFWDNSHNTIIPYKYHSAVSVMYKKNQQIRRTTTRETDISNCDNQCVPTKSNDILISQEFSHNYLYVWLINDQSNTKLQLPWTPVQQHWHFTLFEFWVWCSHICISWKISPDVLLLWSQKSIKRVYPLSCSIAVWASSAAPAQ